MLLPEIEVRNSTSWPWKQGVYLGSEAGSSGPLVPHYQPIDFEVKGQETFKLSVPLQIAPDAPCSERVFTALLSFKGPGGSSFGDLISLRYQVVRSAQDHSLVAEIRRTKLAIKLFEMKLGPRTYEDCMAAVERFDGNLEKCVEALKQ